MTSDKPSILATGLALLLAIGAPLSSARAQPQDAAASQLKEAFAAAQTLFEAGNLVEALAKFQQLTAETGSPNARLYVARTLQQLGRFVEAHDEYTSTIREAAARVEADPKYAKTRDAAAAELAIVQPRVAHVVIASTEATSPPAVSLNGQPVPEASLGAPLTVLPGKQSIRISRPGLPDEEREIEIAAGQTKTLAIGAVASDQGGGAGSGAASSGGIVRILGVVVAGLGVASLATFTATGIASDQKFSTLEAACGMKRCTDPKFGDDIDEGKTLELVANVTLVTGVVLAAASIPMIIFGGPSEDASLAAQLAPDAAYLGFSYRY